MKVKNFNLDVAKLMQDRFAEAKYESFIGGSYRFGYQDENSDVDLFLGVPHNVEADSLIKEVGCLFGDNNFSYKETDGYDDSFILQVKKYNIHLNFYYYPVFNELKKQHLLVEEFLNKNKILKKVRKLAANGSIFYREMLYLATSKD